MAGNNSGGGHRCEGGTELVGGGHVKGGNDRSYTVKNQMIVIKMKLRSNPSRSLLTQYLI